MDEQCEIRLRCIEAAAKNPVPHKDGFVAGVLEAAKTWATWIGDVEASISTGSKTGDGTLGLPKKRV